MNTSALITYLITQTIVVGYTVYYFWKVMKKTGGNNKK